MCYHSIIYTFILTQNTNISKTKIITLKMHISVSKGIHSELEFENEENTNESNDILKF